MLIYAEVTEDRIAQGTRDDCRGCPVALALKGWGEVRVMGDHVEIDGRPHPISQTLRAWIRAYDRGEPVEPLGFEVDTDTIWTRG